MELKNTEVKRAFLVVDDHEVVRHGLKVLIKDFYPEAEIDEAKDGASAEALLKIRSYSLVILDLRMPDTNSFELLEYIVNLHPRTKVLIFSMNSEALYGKRVISAGAHGYLSKESSMEELRKAIETILANGTYISEQLLCNLVDDVLHKKTTNPFSKLSPREFEMATFLLEGLTVPEIAKKVHLQPTTIGTYKSRILEKLNVVNLFQLKELASIYNFS